MHRPLLFPPTPRAAAVGLMAGALVWVGDWGGAGDWSGVWAGVWAADAMAAELTVTVTDATGAALPGAAVSVTPAQPVAPDEMVVIVDQQDEAFHPDVTAIQAGQQIVFRNSDRVAHHVYSFAEAKRFALQLPARQDIGPVSFPTPGIVPLGCNIHDHMLAYVFVGAGPTATTDPDGRVTFADLPAGPATITLWHPAMGPTDTGVEHAVTLSESGAPGVLEARLDVAAPAGDAQERPDFEAAPY